MLIRIKVQKKTYHDHCNEGGKVGRQWSGM